MASSSPPALEQFIRSIPLFSWVQSAEMMDILRLLRPVTLESGQVLFRQGDVGASLWVLGTGAEVTVSATSEGNTRPVVLAYAKSGETLGEMALVDDGPRSATAVVVQGGPGYYIDAIDFHALKDAGHAAAYKVLRKICEDLCKRLRSTNDRIAPASTRTPSVVESLPSQAASVEDVNAFASFAALPSVAKVALSQKLRVVCVEEVTPLFAEGDVGDAAYFLTQGEVTVGRGGRTLATLGQGQVLGLMSCIDGGTRSASVVAAPGARLLRLADRDFDWLFAHGNKVAFQIVDLVAKQLVAYIRRANEQVPLLARTGVTPLPPLQRIASAGQRTAPKTDAFEPDLSHGVGRVDWEWDGLELEFQKP